MQSEQKWANLLDCVAHSNSARELKAASVPLPDGLTRLHFVADKVGVTVGGESAMIDDVTIVNGS